jgi:hypothetical protein
MKKYAEMPEMEIVRFDAEDVITTSLTPGADANNGGAGNED